MTAVVLLVFALDVMLRVHAYRGLLLRCGRRLRSNAWFWFDLGVVAASVALYLVGLLLEEEAAAAGSNAATATRGGKALRGVVVALRWMRASRFAAKLAAGAAGILSPIIQTIRSALTG